MLLNGGRIGDHGFEFLEEKQTTIGLLGQPIISQFPYNRSLYPFLLSNSLSCCFFTAGIEGDGFGSVAIRPTLKKIASKVSGKKDLFCLNQCNSHL